MKLWPEHYGALLVLVTVYLLYSVKEHFIGRRRRKYRSAIRGKKYLDHLSHLSLTPPVWGPNTPYNNLYLYSYPLELRQPIRRMVEERRETPDKKNPPICYLKNPWVPNARPWWPPSLWEVEHGKSFSYNN